MAVTGCLNCQRSSSNKSQKSRPHDIKPSNVVIDSEGNAVIIDKSVIVGVTHEWRAIRRRNF